jgi:hypothetical protein
MIFITLIFVMGARTVIFGLPHSLSGWFLTQMPQKTALVAAAAVGSDFAYPFDAPGMVDETASPYESRSGYWWLDSGGHLRIRNGIASTIQGKLETKDTWHILYAVSNPTDTDGGNYPQSIFRLFTRSSWENVRLESDFQIRADRFLDSPNRNASNGLLLMSRYKDSDNLYYAGIRVDGHAVIKKKVGGLYYTMAEKQIFAGSYADGDEKNLLPHDQWISLRSETSTGQNGAVTVKLYMKKEGETKWTLLLNSTDDGKKFGTTAPIAGAGLVGIRTDFMDVEFDNFKAEKI